MRKLVIAIALLLGIVFLFAQKGEVTAIFQTLKQGDWRFLLMALATQAVWTVTIAAIYQAIFRALGMEESVGRLLILSSASNFINIVAPSAGMGGMAIFVTEARRRNHSPARATVAGVVYVLFDYAAFFSVLSLGLLVLFRRNNLNTPEIIATVILVGIAVFLAFLMLLGMHSPAQLGKVLAVLARGVNKVLRPIVRRDYLHVERAYSFAHDMAEGLHELPQNWSALILPLGLAVLSKGLLVSILYLMFLAFHVPVSVGTLIAGFSIGYLFLIVSPTPAGVGVVEGALALALNSMYVPLGAATVIALAYRGFTFWIPLLVGMISFRWLSYKNQAKTA